jgi:hypothetical protein
VRKWKIIFKNAWCCRTCRQKQLICTRMQSLNRGTDAVPSKNGKMYEKMSRYNAKKVVGTNGTHGTHYSAKGKNNVPGPVLSPPSPVNCPRNRFPGTGFQMGSPHLESKNSGPLPQGFTPETRKRLRADAVKSTHLKPSGHRTGTTTVPCPKPECVQRYQRCAKNQEPSQNKGAPFPHQAQCGRVPD